jgi:hypothetical protein
MDKEDDPASLKCQSASTSEGHERDKKGVPACFASALRGVFPVTMPTSA